MQEEVDGEEGGGEAGVAVGKGSEDEVPVGAGVTSRRRSPIVGRGVVRSPAPRVEQGGCDGG